METKLISDIDDFFDFLALDKKKCPAPIETFRNYPFLVTHSFAQKMQKGNWSDPLLRQVLPVKEELSKVTGFISDPVGDGKAEIGSGLIKKYYGRVLVILAGNCPVHCRFCFRRNTIHIRKTRANIHEAVRSLSECTDINEIIFSGGEPFLLADEDLEIWLSKLSQFKNICTVRFHSRVLSVFPERVTASLLNILKKWGHRFRLILVAHTNHPNEIDDSFKAAARGLNHMGSLIFNQSVLLKGINDTAKEQIELNMALIRCGVVPYYLHQLDRAAGTAHFEVIEETGKKIFAEMRQHLPGYALPKYVKEIRGKKSKIQI